MVLPFISTVDQCLVIALIHCYFWILCIFNTELNSFRSMSKFFLPTTPQNGRCCQCSGSTNRFNLCSLGRFGANAKVVHFLGQIKPWNYTYDPKTKSVKSESHDPSMSHPEFLSLWWDIFTTNILPLLQQFGLVKDTPSYVHVVGSVFFFQVI